MSGSTRTSDCIVEVLQPPPIFTITDHRRDDRARKSRESYVSAFTTCTRRGKGHVAGHLVLLQHGGRRQPMCDPEGCVTVF